MESDDYKEYYEYLIKNGYIDNKGTPLKCQCGAKEEDWDMIDKYYCPYGIEEYTLKCNKCGVIVGHWAYGNWEV